MIKLKKIKRTKRELKYIDIISNFIGLIDGFDCGGEFSYNVNIIFKYFHLSNYDIKLLKKIFKKNEYYTNSFL